MEPQEPTDPHKAEVVIEDDEAARAAEQVAAHQPVQGPASLPGAIVGGLLGASLGALIWWGLVRVSNYELGLVAIGVGVLAGFGVVRGGGRGPRMQLIGAASGALGILAGKVLYYYFGFTDDAAAELARQANVSLEQAHAGIALAKEAGELTLTTFLQETAQAMDLLFYGLGLFEGWRIPRAQA